MRLKIPPSPSYIVNYFPIFALSLTGDIFSMEHLSDRIKSLSESQTIAMARRSRELIAQGVDIIS